MKRTIAALAIVLSVAGTVFGASRFANSWHWHEGAVDRARAHLELRFGSSDDGGWGDWIPVAVVGPPTDRTFPVQFLVSPGDERENEAFAAVRGDLDYYLVELGKRDPWRYAVYHTQTAANLYSRVHWAWITPEPPVSQ